MSSAVGLGSTALRTFPTVSTILDEHADDLQTVVSMQAYTTHRDIDFFPNPEKFDPDRWINADEAELSRMKEMFMPFSKGTRNCIGSHLALMELKLVTAALVSRYTMTVAPTMKESDMDTKDHFLIMTTGDRCELVFERVEAS